METLHTHTRTHTHTHTRTHTHTHTSPLEIPAEAKKLADESNFELKGYQFGAAPEQGRSPHIVRIALVQNAIVRPTTDPVEEQVCVCVFAAALAPRCELQLAIQKWYRKAKKYAYDMSRKLQPHSQFQSVMFSGHIFCNVAMS